MSTEEIAYNPAVPVTVVTIQLCYYHDHMDWIVHRGVLTQLGEDVKTDAEYEARQYGPFDSVEDIFVDTDLWLEDVLHSPGRPWDRSR